MWSEVHCLDADQHAPPPTSCRLLSSGANGCALLRREHGGRTAGWLPTRVANVCGLMQIVTTPPSMKGVKERTAGDGRVTLCTGWGRWRGDGGVLMGQWRVAEAAECAARTDAARGPAFAPLEVCATEGCHPPQLVTPQSARRGVCSAQEFQDGCTSSIARVRAATPHR